MHAHPTPIDSRTLDLTLYADKLRSIRTAIRAEYTRDHSTPWVIGFSAGKDSTLLLQLTLESLLSLAPDLRTREVYVLSNDTLVESPVFQSAVDRALEDVAEGVKALRLPVHVIRTRPEESATFWANMLGRGYPAPNRNFRWCTDRMKIRPTTRFILEKIDHAGRVILLLGVRRAESAHRAGRLAKYDRESGGDLLSPHNDIPNCHIFKPIVDLTDDEVWLALLNSRPPWGGHYRGMITLYRNAKGGECPFVVGPDDAPSCGSTSARFGCWTCTVVEKDSSLDGLIESGFDYLEPLSEFRERLKSISNNPAFRCKTRRNGQPGLGPLTIEAREMLLSELLALQVSTQMPLISQHEIHWIRDQWKRDSSNDVIRNAKNAVRLPLSPEKTDATPRVL